MTVHLELCRRCGHRFDLNAAGFASVSITGPDGWACESRDYRYALLCADCRDDLRAWLGMAPRVAEH